MDVPLRFRDTIGIFFLYLSILNKHIMDNKFQEVGFKEMKSMFNVADDSSLENSLFFKRFKYDESMSYLYGPYKSAGYLAFFCVNGAFNIEINLTPVKVQKNSLIIVVPGNMCRISPTDNTKDVEIVLIACSKEFVSSIRLDFAKLFNDSMNILDTPAITIKDEQLDILRRYLSLADSLIKSDVQDKVEAVKFVISSAFIYLGSIWTTAIKDAEKNTDLKQSVRSKVIFDNFIRLVTEYHNSQRNMSFYAEKLCLTPKYLSKLVKSVSGRSAPEWVDAFVILEAKNLLKYSGRPIKEIVFALNFPNQSVFYKFFKAHTGLTPSEYRGK